MEPRLQDIAMKLYLTIPLHKVLILKGRFPGKNRIPFSRSKNFQFNNVGG